MQIFKYASAAALAGGLLLVLLLLAALPDNLGTFLNLPGILLVIGGTLVATLVSRPLADVQAVLRAVPELLREPQPETSPDVTQLLRFADEYRLGHPRTAERRLASLSNPFMLAGLRMIIDGCQSQELHKALQWRMAGLRTREQNQAQILRSMASFAPAFGMLGTLFGLVHMLAGLGDSGLGEIGGSMAFAMLTTVYGLVAANLILKPLAIKWERRAQQRLLHLQMLAEGMLLVHAKRHSALIRDTLEAFDQHHTAPSAPVQLLSLVKA